MIDVRALAERLSTIESVALLGTVLSTNAIGRRVVSECIDNEIPLPRAIIVARHQLEGRGRGAHTWHSPSDKGIYATTLLTTSPDRLSYLPLWVATIVRDFLRETYAIDARIKWPNDILVEGKKIAGILLEARMYEGEAYVAIGTGINVFHDPSAPDIAVSIAEISSRDSIDLESATEAFVEHVDRALSRPLEPEEILARWSQATVHRSGDPIRCLIGSTTHEGTWAGIDEQGRALLRRGNETEAISSGELIAWE